MKFLAPATLITAAVSVLAQSAPATAATGNTITIISPTGNLAYKAGDPITITWNNNGDATGTWANTAISFEIADASLGVNKVTPVAQLNGTAMVSDLQLITKVPASINPGSAYCVRADIRNTNGFSYFFSPNFPIGMPLGQSGGVASTAAAAQTSANAAASTGAAAAVTTSAAGAATTQGPAGSASVTKASSGSHIGAMCALSALAVFAL